MARVAASEREMAKTIVIIDHTKATSISFSSRDPVIKYRAFTDCKYGPVIIDGKHATTIDHTDEVENVIVNGIELSEETLKRQLNVLKDTGSRNYAAKLKRILPLPAEKNECVNLFNHLLNHLKLNVSDMEANNTVENDKLAQLHSMMISLQKQTNQLADLIEHIKSNQSTTK